MEATSTPAKKFGTKTDHWKVTALMDEADALRDAGDREGCNAKRREAKALFEQFDFKGLVAARWTERMLNLLVKD